MTTLPIQTENAAIARERDYRLAGALFDMLRDKTGSDAGVTRQAYSERESLALDIIETSARDLGLKTERDAGANLVVTLEGLEPTLPFLACGSHLDSVPQGGNFDGAAGVIAGLAVLARFKDEGFVPRRTLKLYGLRGEESARFGKAYIGSSALLGKLTSADLLASASDNGRTLVECMRDVNVDTDRVERGEPLLDRNSLAGWVELHIEQGPVLVAQGLPIGIVTGIRGNVRHRIVECIGHPDHSGTVPRSLRHDAVFATADLLNQLDRHWHSMLQDGHDLVVTAGVLGTDPREHAISRIPGVVRFSFEARSQNKETLEAFYDLFLSECLKIGEERGVRFNFDKRLETTPAVMDRDWIARLKVAARDLGLPAEDIPSGAGHDAAVFANAGIPCGMIFVRNEHGSHNPQESMRLDDLVAGIAVMRTAIRESVR